jgi:DNA mismatch repair protein MutS
MRILSRSLIALTSFAQLAIENNYVCPILDEQFRTGILQNGRHPVIEKQLPVGDAVYCQ